MVPSRDLPLSFLLPLSLLPAAQCNSLELAGAQHSLVYSRSALQWQFSAGA